MESQRKEKKYHLLAPKGGKQKGGKTKGGVRLCQLAEKNISTAKGVDNHWSHTGRGGILKWLWMQSGVGKNA